jgi:hypothetical protein
MLHCGLLSRTIAYIECRGLTPRISGAAPNTHLTMRRLLRGLRCMRLLDPLLCTTSIPISCYQHDRFSTLLLEWPLLPLLRMRLLSDNLRIGKLSRSSLKMREGHLCI